MTSTRTVQKIAASFNSFHPLKFPILLWIGRTPAIYQPQPRSALYLIALLTVPTSPDSWSTLIDLKNSLH